MDQVRAKPPGKLHLVPKPTNGTEVESSVERRIFNFWVWVVERPTARFTNDRKAKIMSRLNDGYDERDIQKAIIGCSQTPWNRGENPNHIQYLDLELICRNGDKLEAYAARTTEEEVGKVLQEWEASRTDAGQ